MKCAKNVPRAGVGKNFNFFDFSKSFQNWSRASYFHLRTTKISKYTHLDEKGVAEWNAQKMSLGPGWGKTSIFFDFSKSFQNWSRASYFHLRTTKISKYTFGWKRSRRVKCAKNVPRAGVGKNFNFFDFSKSFQNWRKASYCHWRTTKISKYTHLDEKGVAGGGRVVRRCCVSYITGASNWYWLTVGQGLLSL